MKRPDNNKNRMIRNNREEAEAEAEAKAEAEAATNSANRTVTIIELVAVIARVIMWQPKV